MIRVLFVRKLPITYESPLNWAWGYKSRVNYTEVDDHIAWFCCQVGPWFHVKITMNVDCGRLGTYSVTIVVVAESISGPAMELVVVVSGGQQMYVVSLNLDLSHKSGSDFISTTHQIT